MTPIDRNPEPDPATTPALRWQAFRIRRHVGWARTQGIRRLIEEDQLDPIQRLSGAMRRARWRRTHDHRPDAVPIFLVGLQRSGTNMITRGLERAPEVEVHNENDRQAFVRFRLRSEPVIRSIVEGSPHAFVLFKPLCDSHRVVELLDGLGTPARPRAIWAYRGFEARVRSSLAKFGDSNLRALRRIADGTGDGLWQAGGLSESSRKLIDEYARDGLTAASASALFWFVRNSLYFELGLDRRPDVVLASYDAMVQQPDATMESLCRFLDLRFRPELVHGIEARQAVRHELEIDPGIRERCESLQQALDEGARTTLVGR